MVFSIARVAFTLFYRRIGIFLSANILWILTSLPLITLPAATGALFYLINTVVVEERELDPHAATIADFWLGFRLHWRRSSLLGGLNVAALAIIIGSFFFYLQTDNDLLGWLVGPIFLIFLALLAMQLYLYPLFINSPQASVGEIFRSAFFYVLAHPVDSYVLISWLFILTVLCVGLGGPVLLLLFSLLAVIQTIALRMIRISRGELPPDKVDVENAKKKNSLYK